MQQQKLRWGGGKTYKREPDERPLGADVSDQRETVCVHVKQDEIAGSRNTVRTRSGKLEKNEGRVSPVDCSSLNKTTPSEQTEK